MIYISIDLAVLSRKLKRAGDSTEYTQDELSELVNDYEKELAGLTEVELTETTHKDVLIRHLRGINEYNTSFYPVVEIKNILIDNEALSTDEYNLLSPDDGIIFIDSKIHSDYNFIVEYTSKTSDTVLENIFYPLLEDFIVYNLVEKGKQITGVTEGSVSVSYNTENEVSINSRIDELKNRKHVIAGMI